MSEEKKEAETITVTITLPTKEAVIKKLTSLFPGIQVTVKPAEKPAREETEEPGVEVVSGGPVIDHCTFGEETEETPEEETSEELETEESGPTY